MATYLPDQRTTVKKKFEKEWYVPTYDYFIEYAHNMKDSVSVQTSIQAANGDIDPALSEYLVKPFKGEYEDLNSDLPFEIRDIDIITDIVEKMMGEYIEMPYNFNVSTHNPDLILEANVDLKEVLSRQIEQMIINQMNQQQETGIPSAETPDLEALASKHIDNHFTNVNKQSKELLEYINEKTDFDYYRKQMFYNWWTTEECYVYRTLTDGQYVKDVILPQNGYPVLGNADFVQNGSAFMWKERLNWTEMLSKWGNRLDKEELDYISAFKDGTHGVPISVPASLITESTRLNWYAMDNNIRGDYSFTDDSGDIDEYNIVFKTFEEIKKLTYIDQLSGEEVMLDVPKDYNLQKEYGDIKVIKAYKEVVYHGVRLGDRNVGVYVKPEKILVQNGELPVTGKVGILKNKKINPIPKRLIAFQLTAKILAFQIERAISKYKNSITLIPSALLDEDDGGTTAQKMFYLMTDGKLVYDSSRVDFNMITQGVAIKTDNSIADYLRVLADLQEMNISRAREMASMNNDRLGNIDTRGGVSNVEQNIYRAKLGSVLSFDVFNKILEKEHEADLEYSKYVFIDGVEDSMFDVDGNVKYISVNGYTHFSRQYGVFIENGIKVDKKLTKIRNLADAAAQNGNFDSAIVAVESENIEVIKEAIDKSVQAERDFQNSMAENQAASAKEIEAMKKETAQFQVNAAEMLQQMKNDAQIESDIIKGEYSVTVKSMETEQRDRSDDSKQQTALSSNDTRERIETMKESMGLKRDRIKVRAKPENKQGR